MNVKRLFAPMAICLTLIVLPLTTVSNAGADTGSSISGAVTDAANPSGLTGVCVTATQNGVSMGTATSGALGAYEVDGLSAGTYDVEFDPSCGGSFSSTDVAQYYSDDYSAASETPVAVGADVDVPGIDAALVAAGTISGTVTDTLNPSLAAGVCVSARDTSDTIGGSGATTTAVDGSYSITGLAPGSFQVFFDPTCSGSKTSYALPQWYLNSTTEGGATPVSVTAGNTSSSVNASLLDIGAISGTVFDPAHPGGVANVCVSVASTDGGGSGTAVTNSSGFYTVGPIAPDTYNVNFDPSCGDTQPTNDVAQSYGSTVTVASGGTTENINVLLTTLPSPPGPGVATTIKLQSSVNPLTSGGVTYSAVVTPTVYTGTISFFDGTVPLSQCQDISMTLGYATCYQGGVAAGAHPITATFSGSPGYLPSTSAILNEAVTPSTATAISSSYNPAGVHDAITFTATTAPSPDGGTVQFDINGTPLSSCSSQPLTNGTSTCQVKTLGPGNYVVTAVYSGDTTFLTSTSTALSEVVLRNSAVSVGTKTGVAKKGQLVHFVGKVSLKYGTGFLFFTNNGHVIPGCGKVKLKFGVAICSEKNFSVGRRIVSVGFSGNSRFVASYAGLLEIIKK
jgi:Big-like domain-containing protein